MSPAPNRALLAMLAEAGWTGAALARRVNQTAAEAGLMLALDRRAASFWLAGRRPRPPLPELIAETLSRGLDRPVSVGDIGLDGRSRTQAGAVLESGRAGAEKSDPRTMPVALLAELAPLHNQRQALVGGAYSLSLLAVPPWAQAARRSRPARRMPFAAAASSPGSDGLVTVGQVATAEQMARLFVDSDSTFGGGYARAALAAYLAYEIVPLLCGRTTSALHARLWSAAAQLAYQCGFMCFDDERHGLAQRYYRAALDLAVEAGDPAIYAVCLRALSVQAHSLGHHHDARQLAEAAVTTGRARSAPLRDAFLLGQVAVAAAAEGDRAAAVTALSAARRRVDQATSGTVSGPGASCAPKAATSGQMVIGAYHQAALDHQEGEVRAQLGDLAGAVTALRSSLAHRPTGERRSRAITSARLAELELALGHLEQAVHTWHAFVEDYPYLRSGRADRSLKIMRSRLLPYSARPAVKALLAKAATLPRSTGR